MCRITWSSFCGKNSIFWEEINKKKQVIWFECIFFVFAEEKKMQNSFLSSADLCYKLKQQKSENKVLQKTRNFLLFYFSVSLLYYKFVESKRFTWTASFLAFGFKSQNKREEMNDINKEAGK